MSATDIEAVIVSELERCLRVKGPVFPPLRAIREPGFFSAGGETLASKVRTGTWKAAEAAKKARGWV